MVLFNYSTKELTAKVVYYGPGLCGKTTNLQYIHANLPGNVKGKMLSLATKTDRTLFFDFLPIDLGEIRGMKTRVQLYTVPGQVFYNETRKLVLKGADGIVFVADSQEQMLGANVESFKNLEENLKAHGLKLADMPHVIQFNKRDLPKLSNIEELNSSINRYNAPFYESVATTGIGVQDSLKAITKLVLLHLTKKYDPASAGVAASARPAAAAPPAAKPVQAPAPARATVAASAGSIPLSEVADAPVATAVSVETPSPTAAPVLEEPVPSFGTDDIDSLVDEVEETVMDTGPALAPEASQVMEPVAEVAEPQLAEPVAEVVEPQVEPPVMEPVANVAEAVPQAADSVIELDFDDADASLEAAGEALSATEVPEPPHFEVDHQIDPDWSPDRQAKPEETLASPVPTPPPDDLASPLDLDEPTIGADEPVDQEPPSAESDLTAEVLTPVSEELAEPADGKVAQDFDEMAAELGVKPDSDPSVLSALEEEASRQERETAREAEMASSSEAPRGEVLLTDVVKDDELFEDPGLDIARIPPRQDHEIVVPVELGAEDGTKLRYKLSIMLRLDPVDE